MSKVQVGKKVRDFKALLDNEETFKLSENKGKNLVFYFYPKDNTPGCTKEGEDFRDNYSVIKKLNTEVIGVSKDSVTSHQKMSSYLHVLVEISCHACSHFFYFCSEVGEFHTF